MMWSKIKATAAELISEEWRKQHKVWLGNCVRKGKHMWKGMLQWKSLSVSNRLHSQAFLILQESIFCILSLLLLSFLWFLVHISTPLFHSIFLLFTVFTIRQSFFICVVWIIYGIICMRQVFSVIMFFDKHYGWNLCFIVCICFLYLRTSSSYLLFICFENLMAYIMLCKF